MLCFPTCLSKLQMKTVTGYSQPTNINRPWPHDCLFWYFLCLFFLKLLAKLSQLALKRSRLWFTICLTPWKRHESFREQKLADRNLSVDVTTTAALLRQNYRYSDFHDQRFSTCSEVFEHLLGKCQGCIEHLYKLVQTGPSSVLLVQTLCQNHDVIVETLQAFR